MEQARMSRQVLDNVELNLAEMGRRQVRLESRPFKVFVEPTQRCNLACTMCWDERRRIKEDLDPALLDRIEAELFPWAAEVDFFLVGEPLLAKGLLPMIERAGRYTFLPKIFSNGMIFDEEIYRHLIRLGFFLNISTDGADKESFESIRVGADFDRFKDNLGRIMALAERTDNGGFHLRLCATIGSYNLEQVPGILELARDLGIRDVMVNDCDMGPPHPRNLANRRSEAAEILGRSLTLADGLGIRFSFPRYIGGELLLERNHNWDDFSLPVDGRAPHFLERYNPVHGDCPYPWIETVVRCDGKVVSCCQKLVEMGDLKRHSFMDIWNNRRYRKLRKRKQFYDCQGYCLLTRNSVWRGEAFR